MMRPTLGDFSSIICLKSIIAGMEDALGEKATAIALISAGRTRGKKSVSELGLSKTDVNWDDIASKLNDIFGLNGTRLCAIDRIKQTEAAIEVYTRETVCSAGEVNGSPRKCTYTLGVVWGSLEQILGKRLQGKHTESVLQGGSHDVFEFRDLNP
jgi:hypothetical protein